MFSISANARSFSSFFPHLDAQDDEQAPPSVTQKQSNFHLGVAGTGKNGLHIYRMTEKFNPFINQIPVEKGNPF